MDVIMLAGGSAGPELADVSECGRKALVRIKGDYMVNLTLRAFKDARLRNKLFLVGNDDIKKRVPSEYYDYFIYEGGDILENVSRGLSHEKIDRSRKVMITSCDIPLIGHEAVDNFIGFSQNSKADVIYPVVEKPVYDARFEGTRRTWYYCMDSTYTGGNFIAMKPEVFFKNEKIIFEVFNNRKNPVKMAAMFGVKLLLKYKMGYATKEDAVSAVENIVKTPCGTFVSRFAEIVFDVDKMSDYIKVCE